MTTRKDKAQKPPGVAKLTKTIVALQYIVKKPFKHDGKQYDPGHIFVPGDGRWDDTLKESHCYSEEITVEVPAGVKDGKND